MKVALLSGAMALALLHSEPVAASTTAAWNASGKAARAACVKAANLMQPKVSSGILFSDTMGKTALLVAGRWPQPHMRGRPGTMLCLYDRRTKRAEASEAPGWQAPPK